MVRIQPGPPHGQTSWGISSAGRAPALQAGGRRFDPDILHHAQVSIGWRHCCLTSQTQAAVEKSTGPFGLSRKWRLFFNNSWITNRDVVDGKFAGVKACRHRAVNDNYDCVNRYSSSKYANTTNLKGKRVNTQILTIQSVISVLDDASLVGWRQSYRVK